MDIYLSSAKANISITTAHALVTIRNTTNRTIQEEKRDRRTAFQARLGRKLDTIQRKISDDVIRLSSHPTDMLRIRAKRDERTGDLISRTIVSSEIIPIIWPNMEKIPLRHLQGYRSGTNTLISSLYTIQQQEYFEIYSPVQCKLEPDDLIVRIVYDDVNCPDDPYVAILQVTEELATVGYSAIRYYTYWCTFYNEALPEKIINIIKAANKKREILNF